MHSCNKNKRQCKDYMHGLLLVVPQGCVHSAEVLANSS